MVVKRAFSTRDQRPNCRTWPTCLRRSDGTRPQRGRSDLKGTGCVAPGRDISHQLVPASPDSIFAGDLWPLTPPLRIDHTLPGPYASPRLVPGLTPTGTQLLHGVPPICGGKSQVVTSQGYLDFPLVASKVGIPTRETRRTCIFPEGRLKGVPEGPGSPHCTARLRAILFRSCPEHSLSQSWSKAFSPVVTDGMSVYRLRCESSSSRRGTMCSWEN